VRERIPTVERAPSLPAVPVPGFVLVWQAEAGKVSHLLQLPHRGRFLEWSVSPFHPDLEVAAEGGQGSG
jgi:hypothetical protein